MLFFLSLIESEEERNAIERIYYEHFDWMLKIAFYFLKNNADAEDAIQDVFLNLIKNDVDLPIDDKERLRSYLFVCIRNSALVLNKKKKIYTVDFPNNLCSKEDMQDTLIKKASYSEVLTYINTMPQIYKDILTLNIVYEKNAKEISKILNIPKKTAETRLRRGRMLVKNQFKEFDL